MSPLQLSILIHYYGCGDDYRNGDFSAPAVRETIDLFRGDEGLLAHCSGSVCYRLTERGRVFVEHLMAQPLPVQCWKVQA
jgi:hypothetical protein